MHAAAEQEERERWQRECEPQQFNANNVRSILAAAALIAIYMYDGCKSAAARVCFGHDRTIII